MCVGVRECMSAHMCTLLWRSENNFQDLVISFYPCGSRGSDEVVGVGSKHLYLLKHDWPAQLAFETGSLAHAGV